MPRPDEECTSCDHCGEVTETPVSIQFPIKGGRSPLDFCPECAQNHMQLMADRLGSEHGSAKVLEVKSRRAKPMVKDTDEDEE